MPFRTASPIIGWALVVLVGLAPGSARAAVFIVTSTANAGAGTLREAVDQANASVDSDNTIVFSAALANATIVLTSELEISNGSLTLDGTSSPGLFIDASGGTFIVNTGESTALTFESVSYTNGTIDLLLNALTFDEASAGTIDGEVISTSTDFTKSGAGTTTLNAGHTIDVTGFGLAATAIDEGTFVVNGDLLANAVTVAEPGTLQIGGNVEATNLTNQGTVSVASGGTVSASAMLVDSTGTLDVDGDVAVLNELSNRGAISVNLGGALSAGSLVVDSAGILDIGGVVSLTDELSDDGTVNVNPGGSLSASSIAIGSGGTLLVDGDVNVGAGAVINDGMLVVNESLTAGSLTIEPSGVLAGNTGATMGVIAPVTVRGRVAPSTSAGVLHVQGPVTFENGSTFEVDVAPGNAGTLQVDGGSSVTIDPGALLAIVADPSAIDAPSTVTILTADGGLTGQFTPVTDYALLEEIYDYQANALVVTLTNTGFSGAAFTPNQRAVAQALDDADAVATGDLREVLDSLDTALAEELPPLLDAIGGEPLTAFATGRQILAERTARALHRRTRDAAWGDGNAFYAGRVDVRAPALALRPTPSLTPLAGAAAPLAATLDVAADDTHAIHADPTRAGAWLDGFGLYGELEGDTGEAEVETILYGGTLGFDVWLAERLLLGLAAGYARSDLDADDRDADLSADTIQGALYAGYTDPRGFLSAYGRYAYSFQDATRRIESSQLSRNARADFDAQDYGAGAEAGITLFSFGRFAFQPIAGVDWLRLTEESYTEKSAGSLGLDVDPEDLESVTGRFGGRLFGKIDLDGAGLLVPELRAFWQREFGDTERVLDARLSGAPGLPAIGVRGPELPRDVLLLGVGWSASVSEQLQILLDYDALLDSDRVEHQGNLAVRVRF